MPLIQDYYKLFENTDDIKKVILNGNIVWPTAKPKIIDYTEPFYSENTTDQTESVTFTRSGTTSPTFDVYYSLDEGNTWNFCGSTVESFTYRNTPHTKVWFCAETTQWTNQYGNMQISIKDCKKVGGNIMSLLYGRNFTGQESSFPSGSSYNFLSLFYNNTNLVDASELLLPATTLASYCYYAMFNGCTSLSQAPALPATTLTRSCYYRMFKNCTSLNEVTCYATSGINENYSTIEWLDGVSSTGTFYKAAGVIWPSGVNGIPSGWTVVEV